MMNAISSPKWLFRRTDQDGNVTDRGLAYVPDIPKTLNSLAAMAAPEDWGRDGEGLHNYLNYTVHKLLDEGKIVEASDDKGEPVAAFATGLLTPDTQMIYAFVTRNRNDLAAAQDWFFVRWAVSSDICMKFFTAPPDTARYWHASTAELFFNPDWQIEVRLEHIVDHNVDRFPRLLQNLPHLRKHALLGAIEEVREQVKANPHLAVPAYHFDRQSLSLLLPLRLVHASLVDLALVVGPFGDERYAAWTVFTLDVACRSARLIKAPSADWLGRQTLGNGVRLAE